MTGNIEYLLRITKRSKKWVYKHFFKRLIDIILALTGLVVASWFYLIIIAIKLDDLDPMFFGQKRVGKGRQYFRLCKFRSMKMLTPWDTPTHLLENPDQYITCIGCFLRKSPFDGIPQLWNILRGDMSVIGDSRIMETTKKNLDFMRVLAD